MRYYYDDPLAAAWMAKHFGMEFHGENGQLEINSDEGSTWFCELCDLGHKYMGPFYIHPDSLHLLEPQEEDIGIDAEGALCNGCKDGWYYENAKAEEYGDFEPTLPVTIIQRNGKAFMWPQSEQEPAR